MGQRGIAGIVLGLSLLAGLAPQPAFAQAAGPRAERFDPEAATEAYLARLTPEQRHRSDAYFEGGYWLTLWDFLYGLRRRLAAAGHRASRPACATWPSGSTRFRPLQTFLYAAQYILAMAVLVVPLGVYTATSASTSTASSTQTFGAWMGGRAQGARCSASSSAAWR